MPVILDLCSGSGAWSAPYKEAGYEVITVDLPSDIRLRRFQSLSIRGILAAPPCTVFARSGAWKERTNSELLDALSIVDACLRAVVIYRPVWWALENPVGKLVHYLGVPRLRFDPCDYGDPWTKRTCLWGEFNIPQSSYVEPVFGSFTNMFHGGQSAERAVTPGKFAKAFFEANK